MISYGLAVIIAIICLFTGTFIGIFIMALCLAASKESDAPQEGLSPDDEVGVWELKKWGEYGEK